MNRNKILIALFSLVELASFSSRVYAQGGIGMPITSTAPMATTTIPATNTRVVNTRTAMPTPNPRPMHLGRVSHVEIAPTLRNAQTGSLVSVQNRPVSQRNLEAMSMGGFSVRSAPPIVSSSSGH